MSKKNNLFGGGPRNILILLLVSTVVLAVLHQLVEYSRQVHPINYTTFLEKVKQDKVKEIEVVKDEVHGILKDGTRFETVLVKDPKHWEILRDHNVQIAVTSPAAQGAFWYFVALMIGIIALFGIWYFIRLRAANSNNGGGGNIFSMGKSRAKMVLPSAIKDNFASVAGAANAKEELQDLVDFLKNPDKYKRLGAKITRGVLLVGAPGNGKTLLARAVAGEANTPFFSVSGSDFIEVFVGVGAARVRDLFAQARAHAPSIIFIDEIDAVGRARGNGMGGGGNDEREQTLNQLLTEMDGFQTSDVPVVVIAATNRGDVLDKALLRPGRFDRIVEVPYPDLASREKILQVHAKTIKMDTTIDLQRLAKGTPGFTGAALANLLNEAAIIASKKNRPMVVIEDIEEARDKAIVGRTWKTASPSDLERKVTAYHEAGHALVHVMLPAEDMDPLYKVSILPRGDSLGHTAWLPQRDKFLKRKEEMLGAIKAALGGRIGEELAFNTSTAGAMSDFYKATEMARQMICHMGMSQALGPVIYDENINGFKYSQDTAQKIDDEVRNLMASCYAHAKEIIVTNHERFEKLANELLEKETLGGVEVYELLGLTPPADHRLTTVSSQDTIPPIEPAME